MIEERVDDNLVAMDPAIDNIKEEEQKEDSEYMLRWSEHNTQLINVFHQLCQSGEFTDVTLATEGEQFKAHKLVLSACSPYFRQLFISNPCKHPVVFLKDISDNHMRLLLEYMYRGSISVKQFELEEILSAASSLKIRGLTTATLPPIEDDTRQDEDAPLVVDEQFPADSAAADKFQHVETSSSHSGRSGSRKAEGRKSSMPKKLRLGSSERDHSGSEVTGSSPLQHPNWFLPAKSEVAGSGDIRVSPIHGGSSENRSPIDHLTDTEEIDSDQPVDFSTAGRGSDGADIKINAAPRYSILGSYLKTGRCSSTTPPEDAYEARRAELAEDLRRAGYGGSTPWLNSLEQLTGLGRHRPASRDSRGDSREERNSSGEDNEKDSKDTPPPLGSLSETLGIDIAGRLRSHFLANLPNQSYAWLNGIAGGPGSINSLSSLASMSSLGTMGSLGTLSSLANLPKESRRGSTDRMDKHPVGGVRTGEIGTNGKPSVACEVCGKKLADPSSLYRHRKIHSGDKPHKCPYCPRRFIQRYNMKQHIKTHRIELMADQTNVQPFVEQENQHNITT